MSTSAEQESIVQKFKSEVDTEEFKRKLIAQLMSCTVGNNPLDFHLADLAATVWMEHFDKNAEELEEFIRSTPFEPVGPPDEGEISVLDTTQEAFDDPYPTLTYKEALLNGIEEKGDERACTADKGAEEA
jgi:hypothetical protein